MPYNIVKQDRGFKVVDDQGREYSRQPMTKYMARRQQRALYASEERGGIIHGSGYSFIDDHLFIHGSGFFSDVWKTARKVARAATAPIRAVVQRVGDVARGVRDAYPPGVRSVIGEYGPGVVANILVRREPIMSFVDKALNFITLGRWQKAKEDLHYDKLYHLGMVVSLTMPDGLERAVLIEKNEVINITPNFTMTPRMDFVRVPVTKQLTLRELLDNAQSYMGEDYFRYDPFKNNCQRFIDSILTANDLNNPTVHAFIVQPVDELLKKLPGYTGKVARAITDVAAVADVALKGRALKKGGRAGFQGRTAIQEQTLVDEAERRAAIQPGDELVACKVKDDLSLGRNVVSTARCKELHDARFAKWEAETNPVRAKFFRPVVEGLTKAADFAVSNVPGINTVAKEVYKTFAPPGSEFYQPGTIAEKAARAALGSGKSKEKWIQKANIKEGAFTAQAKRHKMNAEQFMKHVLDNPDKFTETTRRRAQFMKNIKGGRKPIQIPYSDFLAEHKKLLDILQNPTPEKLRAEYKDQSAELKKVQGKGCGCGCEGGVKPPTGWLKIVKQIAKNAGYDPASIREANGKQKLIITTPEGKEVGFGAAGMGDYIIYSLLEKQGKAEPGTAEKHRKAYLARATKIKGNWKADKYSPNSLAIRILWAG